MSLSLEERFLHLIRKHSLFHPGDTVVVAVSGGPDSVCLLHLLYRFQDELGIGLHVAHLDHSLRGAESQADADYVAHLAHELNIPITLFRADVALYRHKERLSLEEAAREVRYAFLAGVAEEVGASAVALGHTRDDQAETVLLHVLRGCGVEGLAGLRPRSKIPVYCAQDCPLVRPLLRVSREETRLYCQEQGLEAREDATNLSTRYLRNRIRLELLPLLRLYNPRIEDALVRLSLLAGDEASFVRAQAAPLKEAMVSYDKGSAVIEREPFDKLPDTLKRYMIRDLLHELSGESRGVEAVHVEAVMQFLGHPAGQSLHLKGVVVSTEYSTYRFSRPDWNYCPYPKLEGGRLNVPGETTFPGWRVEATLSSDATYVDAPFTAFLDYERLELPLSVRPLKHGDRFLPLGSPGEKKLYRFMGDVKIPHAYRARVPLVVDASDRVVWLVGYRLDDRFKLTPQTRKVLRLQFSLLRDKT